MFGKATILALFAATAQIVAGQNTTATVVNTVTETASRSFSFYSSYPIYRSGSCFTTSAAVNGSSSISYTTSPPSSIYTPPIKTFTSTTTATLTCSTAACASSTGSTSTGSTSSTTASASPSIPPWTGAASVPRVMDAAGLAVLGLVGAAFAL